MLCSKFVLCRYVVFQIYATHDHHVILASAENEFFHVTTTVQPFLYFGVR